MNPSELERMLAQGQPTQIPVVRVTTLGRANVTIERRDEAVVLVIDLLLSPAAAERYELPFSDEGWAQFEGQVMEFGSGLTIARLKPQ